MVVALQWILSLALPTNASHAVCHRQTSVCECARHAPTCGWCSSTKTCAPASQCTLTCRECTDSCRKSCRKNCVNTCSVVTSVCACAELDGCGWCSHGGAAATGACAPYPECSTTCDECDSKCASFGHCKSKCYQRFRPHVAKPLEEGLFPLDSSDAWCAFAVFLATVFASAAGIGGGAVLVPLFTLIGHFTEHEAIPLALSTVFGASLFSTFGTFLWLKHPHVPHRQMIAYDVVQVLLPMTLLGTTVGVFLNKVCPNWLIMTLLILLCAVVGQRTLVKARKAWDKESHSYETVPSDSAEQEDEALAAKEPMLPKGSSETEEPAAHEPTEQTKAALEVELAAEARCNLGTPLQLMCTWVIVLGLALLKGGHGAPSLVNVPCGSLGYWGVVGLNFPVLAALTAIAACSALRTHRRRVEIGYQYAEGDVLWDAGKAVRLPMLVFVGAITAGMLGVGGGMILGPIFTELNFLPEVGSATSTIMVLFMSSATVGQFVIFGMIDMEYALFFGSVGGVLGAIVGTKGARVLLKRTGRPSFIVYCLAFILFGSGLLMLFTGSHQLLQSGVTGFRPICGRAGDAANKD